MYKRNQKHLQPTLIDNVSDLPEELRQRLEGSWAGVYYREFFCRINEDAFAVVYSEIVSRPNTPVNVWRPSLASSSAPGWKTCLPMEGTAARRQMKR